MKGARQLVGASALIFSICLIGLAVPHFFAAIIVAPSAMVMADIANGQVPSGKLIDTAEKRYRRVEFIYDKSPIYPDNLGLLELLKLSENDPGANARRDQLLSAYKHHLMSVRQAPFSSRSWARLSYINWLRAERLEDIVKYLRLSYLTGARDYKALAPRMWVALNIWHESSVALQNYARQDFDRLWEIRPGQRQLAEIFSQSGLEQKAIISELIGNDEKKQKHFLSLVLEYMASRPSK